MQSVILGVNIYYKIGLITILRSVLYFVYSHIICILNKCEVKFRGKLINILDIIENYLKVNTF